MIGFLSSVDENKNATKDDISFVHIVSDNDDDIKLEVAPLALAFSRKLDLEKVYLFYGKDKKIIYEYSL